LTIENPSNRGARGVTLRRCAPHESVLAGLVLSLLDQEAVILGLSVKDRGPDSIFYRSHAGMTERRLLQIGWVLRVSSSFVRYIKTGDLDAILALVIPVLKSCGQLNRIHARVSAADACVAHRHLKVAGLTRIDG
jgi:hypothetical protein